MASQFIHSNNQSLLWKVINNTPQTINYFANAVNGEKERWFQTVIGHVYNQYNGQNISLRDMNKRAIDFMLQSLAPSTSTPSTPSVTAPALTAPAVPYKNREQQVTDQFTRRQAEYESMIKKETPTPHFIENVKDEAILDLGSAVKEYMKQRDQDNEVNLPPSPTASSPTASSPTASLPTASLPTASLPTASSPTASSPTASLPPPFKLDLKNAEPISLSVDELPSKKVQWGENVEHVFDKNESIINYNRLEKDILEIKTKLDLILAILQK
jgi:hypothetical protein